MAACRPNITIRRRIGNGTRCGRRVKIHPSARQMRAKNPGAQFPFIRTPAFRVAVLQSESFAQAARPRGIHFPERKVYGNPASDD